MEFRFTGGEFIKVKRILAALAACFCVGAGLTCYSVWSMSSLRAENELYRNQLRMAEERWNPSIRRSIMWKDQPRSGEHGHRQCGQCEERRGRCVHRAGQGENIAVKR